jgi:hypothetical protein
MTSPIQAAAVASARRSPRGGGGVIPLRNRGRSPVAALPQMRAFEFLLPVLKARESAGESKRVQSLSPKSRRVVGTI